MNLTERFKSFNRTRWSKVTILYFIVWIIIAITSDSFKELPFLSLVTFLPVMLILLIANLSYIFQYPGDKKNWLIMGSVLFASVVSFLVIVFILYKLTRIAI